MPRAPHRYLQSMSVDGDDLTALKEYFCNNSFALVPSALTPSRPPSNSFIGSSRHQSRVSDNPVRHDFLSLSGKGGW